MSVTPYDDNQTPRFRQPKLNEKTQAFIDKLIGVTIPEMNALVSGTVAVLSPSLETADFAFATTQQGEGVRQTYYIAEGATKVLTFSDAAVIHDYTNFTDVILGGSTQVFDAQAIVDVWWRLIGGVKHAYFLETQTGNAGGGGACVLEPPVPTYGMVDCTAPDYTITDY